MGELITPQLAFNVFSYVMAGAFAGGGVYVGITMALKSINKELERHDKRFEKHEIRYENDQQRQDAEIKEVNRRVDATIYNFRRSSDKDLLV